MTALTFTKRERAAIQRAELIIAARWAVAEDRPEFTAPGPARELLQARLATAEREVFTVLFLNSQHKLIAAEDLFYGTIDGAAVYPREIVKRALALNAAALILGHNHPSGVAEPSAADRRITERITSACALIDLRVLDHIIVSGAAYYSFAEQGII